MAQNLLYFGVCKSMKLHITSCTSVWYVRVGMELGWGGFVRAKLDMLILIRIPFSFHVTS